MPEPDQPAATSVDFRQVNAPPEVQGAVEFLDAAAVLLGEHKRASYEMLGIQPSMAVLDAGCGTGDDARAMAEIVGQSGKAVGFDLSEGILEVARARSEAAGVPVKFVQADVLDLPFADATFDACRAERLLQHLDNPTRGLAELIRVTKPGGRVFLAEVDCDTLVIDVPDPKIIEKLRAFWATGLQHARMGRQLHRLAGDAGLVDIAIQPQTMIDTADSRAGSQVIDRLAQRAHTARALSDEEFQTWSDYYAEAQRENRYFQSLSAFAVCGRKPG